MRLVGSNYCGAQVKTSLRVIERGDIFTTVESIYDTGKSEIRVAYTVYKDFDYIDVEVDVCWNEVGKGLKLQIPVKEVRRFIGQTAFGTQEYEENLEQCSQRFCAVEEQGNMFALFKDGTYGCSIENGMLYITLLNGSVYCAHPIGERPIIDEERFNRYIDLGRHKFSFRLEVCKEEELERRATEFTQKPYALNFYPHGNGTKKEESPIKLSDKNITISSFRKVAENTYEVRLINNFNEKTECNCSVFGKSIELAFGKYEVKTLCYKNGKLKENDGDWDIL